MNKLLFRADGNAEIGLGHVMRCLALADMLKDDFSMHFAIVSPTPTVQSMLENAGLSVLELPESESETAFLDQIESDEVVVLDGYLFGETFQRDIRKRAKKLVFVDDLANSYQVADVLINHTGGMAETDYEAEPYTQFCLGPNYALLRPEFLRPEGFGEVPADGPIFVNMGGADPQNNSLKVMDGIRQVDNTLPVHLVLGPFHPYWSAIETYEAELPNLTILQDLTAEQMANELQGCQLAITSCSTIAYEVCAVNRPLITVLTADNQTRLAQFLSEGKLALSVNFPTLLNRLTPVISLENMLKLAIQGFQFSSETVDESLASQRRLFDGRSPERLRTMFQELTESK